jgi:ferredoxin
MAYVVTELCIKKKYTDCVVVCPVDCFHEDKEMLVIDPTVCIDCGACIPVCPVKAIFAEEDVPQISKLYIKVNAEKFKQLPSITKKQKPLASS